MKLKLRIQKLRGLRSRTIPYLRKHTDQAVVVVILLVVMIAALISSYVFYRFALNPREFSEEDIGYKEIKVRSQEGVFDQLEKDKVLDKKTQEKIQNVKDPFN